MTRATPACPASSRMVTRNRESCWIARARQQARGSTKRATSTAVKRHFLYVIEVAGAGSDLHIEPVNYYLSKHFLPPLGNNLLKFLIFLPSDRCLNRYNTHISLLTSVKISYHKQGMGTQTTINLTIPKNYSLDHSISTSPPRTPAARTMQRKFCLRHDF